MSEYESPLLYDQFERFYDQLHDEIVEQIKLEPPSASAEFSELLLQSINHDEGSAEFFRDIVKSAPDESFLEMVGLVEAIERMTTNYLETAPTKPDRQPKAITPDFAHAQLLVDGLLVVPVADRNSLRDYLDRDEVAEALGSYLELDRLDRLDRKKTDNEPKETFKPKPITRSGYRRTRGSEIRNLPEIFTPLHESDLFEGADYSYWKKEDREKYVLPSDTLEDIVQEAPDELIIPLLLCLEEDFSVRLRDEPTQPIIADDGPRKYFVEHGIVWRLYTTDSVRSQIKAWCHSEPSGFGSGNFDFQKFDDDYCQENTDSEGLTKNFPDTLNQEEHRRLRLKNGLF